MEIRAAALSKLLSSSEVLEREVMKGSSQAVHEAAPNPSHRQATDDHCELLHILRVRSAIESSKVAYAEGMRELNGFRSRFLMYEKKISIGAILN